MWLFAKMSRPAAADMHVSPGKRMGPPIRFPGDTCMSAAADINNVGAVHIKRHHTYCHPKPRRRASPIVATVCVGILCEVSIGWTM